MSSEGVSKENLREYFMGLCGGDENIFNENTVKYGPLFLPGHGTTMLQVVSVLGFTFACRHLIENCGYDVNQADDDGYTPLHYAAREGHVETVVYLIEKGAKINRFTKNGLMPLHDAVEKGHTEVIQLLISKGAEVDAYSNTDIGTPLHFAIFHDQKDSFKMLLDNKANPNIALEGVLTPLFSSIAKNLPEYVQLLLEAGASPHTSPYGTLPLGQAAAMGQTESVKHLLEAGANPNQIDLCGFTPFETAFFRGHVDCVKILFPATSPLPSLAEWDLSVIILQMKSEEFKAQEELVLRKVFEKMKLEGGNAFRRKEYYPAVGWYTQAIDACPSEASVWSNRSLCWASMKSGSKALSDAEECVRLKPDWSKAHYREGAAWKLCMNYPKAIEAFNRALKLDPNNRQIQMELQSVIEEQSHEAERQVRELLNSATRVCFF